MSRKQMFMMLLGLGLLLVSPVVAEETFSVGAFGDIELGNDTQVGPDASSNGSGIGARNAGTRRRVVLISYDISEVKGMGSFFSDVYLNHFSHDLHGETNVYGVIEELDLLDVEALTWNTAPGVKNDPAPALYDRLWL